MEFKKTLTTDVARSVTDKRNSRSAGLAARYCSENITLLIDLRTSTVSLLADADGNLWFSCGSACCGPRIRPLLKIAIQPASDTHAATLI